MGHHIRMRTIGYSIHRQILPREYARDRVTFGAQSLVPTRAHFKASQQTFPQRSVARATTVFEETLITTITTKEIVTVNTTLTGLIVAVVISTPKVRTTTKAISATS
jgi:hypothetical protein